MELHIFSNSEFGEIRTITKDNEPMFCLVDVCKALEISNVSQLKTRLKEDGVITNEVGVQTGIKADGTPAIQKVRMNFINESNLYKTSIEEETPLYGCEIEEVQKHVRKKGIEVLGGKDSNAYKDGGIRGSVYSDIYKQLKREFGCVATYKSIKRKYLADVHEFIDTYLLPIALAEVVHDTNM